MYLCLVQWLFHLHGNMEFGDLHMQFWQLIYFAFFMYLYLWQAKYIEKKLAVINWDRE